MERYRAELRTRKRKKGESIQAVYQDIRRLLALGFPGQSGELCEIIGRDAFLDALCDSALRIRVLDQQPATLDEALNIVCRMEAYSSVNMSDDVAIDNGHRKVRSVAANNREKNRSGDDSRIKQLDELMTQQPPQLSNNNVRLA